EAFRRLSGASEPAAVVWAAMERSRLTKGESSDRDQFEDPFDALIAAGRAMIKSGKVPGLQISAELDSAWLENLVAWLFGGHLKVEVVGRGSGYRLQG
ncbi:MAG TPA: hypothetical protein VJP40_01940, partial [bacterium]|nr:hypothetical protein [bacterium]